MKRTTECNSSEENIDYCSLKRQQLARNYVFFGEENQKKIENSFIIVVGVGGVGSHAAYMLARAGVSHIRLIDFDTVTITSLNRHSCAILSDVGKSKVEVMKQHIHDFMPSCEVDTCESLINKETCSSLLEGNPDFILDCIDDYQGKLLVIEHCIKNHINFISSMGAAAKIDPTRIYIGDISDARGDGLAEKLRFHLKQHGYYQDPPSLTTPFVSIPCIYSTEKPVVNMLSLEESKETKKYDSFNNNENTQNKNIDTTHLRTRVIPVMGCIPAIFGQSLCAHVLAKISSVTYAPLSQQVYSRDLVMKLFNRLSQREKNRQGENNLDYYDIAWLVQEVFHGKCVYTNKGITGNKVELCRWDPTKPVALNNVILCLKSMADKHEQYTSLEQVDPTVRKHVEELLQKANETERLRFEI